MDFNVQLETTLARQDKVLAWILWLIKYPPSFTLIILLGLLSVAMPVIYVLALGFIHTGVYYLIMRFQFITHLKVTMVIQWRDML